MNNRTSRRNWRLILVQGLFYSLKRRLAPPKIFLPFICVAAGAPVFLAAVIVPLFTVATRSSELLSAPLVSGAQRRKSYAMIGIGCVAVGLVIAIVSIYVKVPLVTAACLAGAAVVIGIGRGISGIAYTSLLPSLFDREIRGRLLNLEGILSAIAALLIALAAYHVFKDSDPLHSHMALAWLALLVAIPAAVLLFPVNEPDRALTTAAASGPAQQTGGSGDGSRGTGEALRRFRLCWGDVWFRKYLTARILLLSVTQAMPFYSIQAASLHKHQSGSYAAFVVAMSVGAILSGPVLHKLAGRSVGTNLAAAIFFAMLAAAFALMIDVAVPASELKFYHYVPVFVLAALAAQVATVSLAVYLGEIGSDHDREFYVATGRFASGVLGTIVAVVLGVVAQMHNEAIPIAIILCINAIAFVFVVKSLGTRTGEG
jgi:MFS family permease